MNLSNLKPAAGSTKNVKRLGRGQGSGRGGTSTKGHKGAQSRSGYSRKFGFEGGQMPIQRRLPKFGFTNMNRVEYKGINVSTLNLLCQKFGVVDFNQEVLIAYGMVSKNDLIKILGNGTLDHKIQVTAHAFSKSAVVAIEAKQGTASII